MKGLCIKLLMIALFCLPGYYNPAAAQDQRNSAGSYSQYMQENSAQRGGGVREAPPGDGDGGNAIEFRTPVGPGFPVLIGLSFCYLSYILVTQSKKEKK